MKKMPLLLIVIALCAIACFAQPAPTTTASPAESKAAARPAKPGVVLPPEKSQPVRLPPFDKPPVIDVKLDDEIWKQAIVLKDFYQVQPGDNIAPSKPTEVLLGHDAKFLYIAFHCYDEPDKVRATIAKRDNIWNDDYVGILFDTFNDSRKAYEFDFNPLGVQADGTWTDQGEDFNPDIVMESKGMVTSDGWTVEVASLRCRQRQIVGRAFLAAHQALQQRTRHVDADQSRHIELAGAGRTHYRSRRNFDRANARVNTQPHVVRNRKAKGNA